MRTFTIGFHGGWGARLLMLGAAIEYANMHGRRLRVYWSHLFPCPWHVFSPSPMELVSEQDWTEAKRQQPAAQRWDVGMEVWTHDLGASEIENVVLSATYIPKALGITESVAVWALRKAVDLSRVERRADALGEIPEGLIGVHVRGTDHADAVRRSPIDLFERRMAAFSPGAKFFVCSDETRVKHRLQSQFEIVTTRVASDRRSMDGLLDDCAEMLLLSRCRRILGSYGSSFSLFAALYGGGILETIDNGA